MKKYLAFVAILIIVLACCAQSEDVDIPQIDSTYSPSVTPVPTAVELSEFDKSFVISGSTAVEKIGTATLDEFIATSPYYEGDYKGVGSSRGVKAVVEGSAQIGAISRELTEEEREYGLSQTLLGYEAIAVIVNKNVTIDDISLDELQGIYAGEITNWSEVGGDDAEIAVWSREDGSGVRGGFMNAIECEDRGKLSDNINIWEGSAHISAIVADTPYSIGYISLRNLGYDTKVLSIDGNYPTYDNIFSGTYSIAVPYYYVYHEENLNQAAKDYLEFLKTDLACEIMDEKGIVTNKIFKFQKIFDLLDELYDT